MIAKIYKKKIPIYFGELWVVIADDFKKAGEEMGITFREGINDCLGVAVTKRTEHAGVFLIMIKTHKIDHHDVVAHESLHTVNAIFESRGVEISTSNDEPQCYMLGWIVNEVENAIKRHKELK